MERIKGFPIKFGQRYTIVYKTKYDNKIRIDHGAYRNYEQDDYIGHDDEEGNSRGPRFYFDDVIIPEYGKGIKDKTIILAIDTDENFIRKIKEIYSF